MKHLPLRFAAGLFIIATAAMASWYDDYDKGLAAARNGDWHTVIETMTSAIAGSSKESDRARTYGANFVKYHPYYYRGIAYVNSGRYREARADLVRAQGPGPLDLGSIESWLSKLPAGTASAPVPVGHPSAAPTPTPTAAAPSPSIATKRPLSAPPVIAAAPPSPVPAAFPADDELNAAGSIAFNTPPSMTVGEQKVIQLLLDPNATPAAVAGKITQAGRTETATIRISKTIEAKLSGAAFDIRAITPEVQPLSGKDATEWRWEVTARQSGPQRLFLTINALLGDAITRRTMRTYDHTIEVHVSPRTVAMRYAAIGGGFLTMLAVAIALIRRRAPVPPGDTSSQPTAVLQTPVRASVFEEGQIIAHRYRILRFVGRGGMGAIYAAEDRELSNETVAIKTILAGSTDPDRALARLRREIQVARRVAHPNVCRVFDVGYHDLGPAGRTLFVTMQFIEGRTLADIIRERGRFDTREARRIVADLSAALDATHRAGLIHRDVKTANVMIANGDGRAILMDFGLARTEREDITDSSITQTGAIVGSPVYMAPEQLQDTVLTPATDVYAFGIVIYEMVTGRLPFEGDSAMSILARRLREPPIPPSHFVEGLDPVWEAVILKCLETDAARRYQSAQQVWQAIEGSGRTTTQIV